MPKSDQKKAAALAALMECDTFTEAAKKAGIDRKTLYNYLTNDTEFADAYHSATRQRVLERAEKAETYMDQAINAIAEIMNDKEQPAGIRLKAALALTDVTPKNDSVMLAEEIKETAFFRQRR